MIVDRSERHLSHCCKGFVNVFIIRGGRFFTCETCKKECIPIPKDPKELRPLEIGVGEEIKTSDHMV